MSQHLAKPEQHGTTTGYRYGCTCDACRDAHAANQRRYRAEGPKGRDRGGRTHGLIATYNHGCRCDKCRERSRLQRRRQREAKREAA